MSDLLEDPDGAPYPDEVQTFYETLNVYDIDTQLGLVAALEAVAASAWADGFASAADSYTGGDLGLPRNPHERRPPPVPKTPEEKRAFSRDWDARYEAGRSKRADQG